MFRQAFAWPEAQPATPFHFQKKVEKMDRAKEIYQAAQAAGGSFKTVSQRAAMVARIFDELRQKQNIQVHSLQKLKLSQIETYVASRIEDGLGKRTLQNQMSALRTCLQAIGRETLLKQDRFSNKALGIADASRYGTKTAMSNDKFDQLISQLEKMDKGVAACAHLERWLGLRGEEAVRSVESLKSWQKQIEAGLPVRVVFGTKGGRPRDTRVVNKEMAAKAVQNALKVMKAQGGKLVDKPSLHQAMNRLAYVMRQCGAIGKDSAHSLRYAFTADRVESYRREGFTERESLAMTSTDLGHGDGRGTYVAQVYLK